MKVLERPVTGRVASRGRAVLAAGAVVTREHPTRGTEVVIVHRKRYDDWSLPKGKLEAGESLPACAVREVQEETGVTVRLDGPLDQVSYERGGTLKRVDWWAGSVVAVAKRAPTECRPRNPAPRETQPRYRDTP